MEERSAGHALVNKGYQRAVIRFLVSQPESITWYTKNEIRKTLRIPQDAITRIMEQLVEADLAKSYRVGRIVGYQANRNNPLIQELQKKTESNESVYRDIRKTGP